MNLEYCLFTGDDIRLECGIIIKQPSLKEIEDIDNGGIGYSEYESIIWMLTRYPYEFKFDLEDSGIDYKELNTYDMFIILARQADVNTLKNNLSFLFGSNVYIENGFLRTSDGVINKDSIEEIKTILNKIMFFKKPKERVPANEDAKRMIKRQIKMQNKKGVKYNIYSIMHGVVNSDNSSETYSSIVNRSVHQIYASYIYTQKHKDFDNTMHGVYAGVVKSDDVDIDNINWINKVD